jgi:hypothetical protein
MLGLELALLGGLLLLGRRVAEQELLDGHSGLFRGDCDRLLLFLLLLLPHTLLCALALALHLPEGLSLLRHAYRVPGLQALLAEPRYSPPL